MANKQHLNLSVDIKTYQEAKKLLPPGEISKLFSNFLKEYLKKQRERELIAGYQANAKNKKLQAELGAWEKISVQDIAAKLEKDE
jgi:hypothetical protein